MPSIHWDPRHRYPQRNTKTVSTDLLLCVLYSLGTAKITFKIAAPGALHSKCNPAASSVTVLRDLVLQLTRQRGPPKYEEGIKDIAL